MSEAHRTVVSFQCSTSSSSVPSAPVGYRGEDPQSIVVNSSMDGLCPMSNTDDVLSGRPRGSPRGRRHQPRTSSRRTEPGSPTRRSMVSQSLSRRGRTHHHVDLPACDVLRDQLSGPLPSAAERPRSHRSRYPTNLTLRDATDALSSSQPPTRGATEPRGQFSECSRILRTNDTMSAATRPAAASRLSMPRRVSCDPPHDGWTCCAPRTSLVIASPATHTDGDWSFQEKGGADGCLHERH